MKKRLLLTVMSALLLASGTARAGEHPDARNTAIQANPFQLNPSGRGILSTGSAETMTHTEFRASVVGQYVTEPLIVRPNDDDAGNRSLVAERQQIDVSGAVGLFDRFEFGFVLPMTVNQDAQLPGFGLGPVAAGGIGNVELYGLANILSQDNAPFALAVGGPVRLPTKTAKGYFGASGISGGPQIRLSRYFGPIQVALSGDVMFRPRMSLNNIDEDDRFRWRSGLFLAPVDEWGIGAEFIGATPLASPFDAPNATRGEIVGGGRFRPTRRLDIHIAAGRGVIRGVGAPAFRLLLGLSFHHGRPIEGEDVARCSPNENGTYEGVSAEDCPDSDFDGDEIANADDRCAKEAEDTDGFEDGDGCPDTDNDEDGVEDVADACPNVAEDADSYLDSDGCPDLDNDADGIVDATDECSLEPEDYDGFDEKDGCPDHDNDNDGLADVDDECFNAPGEPENGGCPKEAPPEATVTQEEIEISEKIFFVYDRAIVRPRSYDVLEKVGEALRTHPAIEKIEIRGYADERGKTEYNYQLSIERAKVVRLYLIHNAGVNPDRLQAAGYGELKPQPGADKKEAAQSQEDWAQARRVEFKILERSE